MYARDARQQQANVPAGRRKPYPSTYGNFEELELSTPGSQLRPEYDREWLHHPLTPGQSATWTSRSGIKAGAVRSIYTAGNPKEFDVAYHDPRRGTSARGSGKFGLATYHAAEPPSAPSSSYAYQQSSQSAHSGAQQYYDAYGQPYTYD